MNIADIFKDISNEYIIIFYEVAIQKNNKIESFFRSENCKKAYKVFSRLVEEAKNEQFIDIIYLRKVFLKSVYNSEYNMYFSEKCNNYSIKKNDQYFWEDMEG